MSKMGRLYRRMHSNLVKKYKTFHIYFLNGFIKNNYTITNCRVSLSKICHEWPNNAVTHECLMSDIFDNETRQLVLVFII
jgi:hypothetical protein